MPEFNALFLVSFFLFLNCYSLIDLIGHVTKTKSLTAQFSVLHGLVIGSVIIGVSYFILVKDRRYEKTAEQFNKESKAARTRNLILCILYFTATLVIVFWLA